MSAMAQTTSRKISAIGPKTLRKLSRTPPLRIRRAMADHGPQVSLYTIRVRRTCRRTRRGRMIVSNASHRTAKMSMTAARVARAARMGIGRFRWLLGNTRDDARRRKRVHRPWSDRAWHHYIVCRGEKSVRLSRVLAPGRGNEQWTPGYNGRDTLHERRLMSARERTGQSQAGREESISCRMTT